MVFRVCVSDRVHWEGKESERYLMTCPGQVGESSHAETSITVSGLQPDRFYGIRVVAVNANNDETASDVIRLKTLSRSASDDGNASPSTLARSDSRHGRGTGSAGDHHPESPGARTYRYALEPAAPSTTGASVVARERGPNDHLSRRPGNGRRASPLTTNARSRPSNSGPPDIGDVPASAALPETTVEQLTEKLDRLRRETEEIHFQKCNEEVESRATVAATTLERDRLKQVLKDRDDASAELRREVTSLERQNRAVQSNKTTKGRLLRQKLEEREKIQQDISRWNQETEDYRRDAERMTDRKRKLLDETEGEVKAIREQIAGWQAYIKEMEEDIRLTGAQIKEQEDRRRRTRAEEDEQEARDRESRAREDDVRWELSLRDLQFTYTRTLHSVQQVRLSIGPLVSLFLVHPLT